MSRVTKLFITASVIINFLLAGFILGHTGRDMLNTQQDSLLKLIASLPEDKRKALEDEVHQTQQSIDTLHKEIDKQREEASNALMAPSFDRQAYLSYRQHIYDLQRRMMTYSTETIADVAAECNLQERITLADIIRKTKPFSRRQESTSVTSASGRLE